MSLTRILGTGFELTDTHIDFFQHLIHQAFPNLDGFQNPVASINHTDNLYTYRARGKFIQIFRVHENHWITASNIGCKGNSVAIYDSAFDKKKYWNELDKFYISKLIACEAVKFNVYFPRVTQQLDGKSCGYFAVMYAYLLANNVRPETVVIHPNLLKPNLCRMIKTKNIHNLKNVYSYLKKKITHEPRIGSLICVHCVCRTSSLVQKHDMICCTECEKWFHKTCCKDIITEEQFENLKKVWLCRKCR